MKGHTLPGINQRKGSMAKDLGGFIGGKRATFEETLAAEEEGKAVTYTDKEAQKKLDDNLKKATTDEEKTDAQMAIDLAKRNKYKGPGGKEQAAFDQAKADDKKAQMLLEKRKKILSGETKTGKHDAEGRQGSIGKTAEEKAFEEKNKYLKTEAEEMDAAGVHYGVLGSSKTISSEGALKGSSGSKSKVDYDNETAKREKEAIDLKISNQKKKTY